MNYRRLWRHTWQLCLYYKYRFILALVAFILGTSVLVSTSMLRHNLVSQADHLLGIKEGMQVAFQVVSGEQFNEALFKRRFEAWGFNRYALAPYSFEASGKYFQVVGVDDDFFSSRHIFIDSGREFTPVDQHQLVAIVGAKAQIGQWLKLNDAFHEIIGQLSSYQTDMLLDFDYDHSIFVPISTLKTTQPLTYHYVGLIPSHEHIADLSTWFKHYYPMARVLVKDTASLRERLLQNRAKLLQVMSLMAKVVLFLGLISVINVWFILMQQRLDEIHLRQILGARISDIMQQFTVEAALISSISAGAGLVFGTLAAYIITHTLQCQFHLFIASLGVGLTVNGIMMLFLVLTSGIFAYKVYMRGFQ